MKILREGIDPKPTEEWWIGRKITCTNCMSFFQLEKSDEPNLRIVLEKRMDGDAWLTCKCPTCHRELTRKYPASERKVDKLSISDNVAS